MILTILRYHAEDFTAAHAFAEIAAGLQPFCAGFVTRAEHALFYALATAAVYPAANREQRAVHDAKLAAIREQMRRWVALCAENTEHMQLLVEAECARLRDARIEAADLYDRAIAAARANSYLNIEALAAELGGRFWLAAGKPDFARIYLDKALDAYVAWGAAGKVADLRAKYGLGAAGGATVSVTSGSTTLGSSAERSDALDLATLLKASQAIAGEIVLERLLVELMDIIRENAGAESVVIVLESNGEFLVQAVRTASGVARILVAEPLRHVGRLLDGYRELRAAHVGARRARRRSAAGQVSRRRVRRESPAEVDPLRARHPQGQAHRRPSISRTTRSRAHSRRIGSRRSTS